METTKDYKAEEMAVGVKAARLLQAGIRKYIGFETVKSNRNVLMHLSESTVKPFGKNFGLDALIIKSPKYGFMLNYGFEGVKSNGIAMKLKATNHLADGIEKTGVLEILADELTDIKGEKVLATIDFRTRG